MNDVERLVRAYRIAARELRDMVYSLEFSQYTSAGAAAAVAKAEGIARMLTVNAENWAKEAIPAAYKKQSSIAKTQLEILGRKPRHTEMVDRPMMIGDDLMVSIIRANNSIPELVEQYVAVSAMAANSLAAVRVQEFSYEEMAADVEAAAQSVVKSQAARRDLTMAVRARLRQSIGDEQFILINGRRYQMTKYAEMVGRTAMREAQTAATLDLCRIYENDLVQWSEHGTVCPICRDFEGKIYSISGKHPIYPMMTEEPPAHPNCEHSLLPVSDEALGFRTAGWHGGLGTLLGVKAPWEIAEPVVGAPGERRKPGPKPGSKRTPKAEVPPDYYKNWTGPAKTKAEAEKWAKQHLCGGRGYVSYNGTSLDVANLINKELSFLESKGIVLDSIEKQTGNNIMTVYGIEGRTRAGKQYTSIRFRFNSYSMKDMPTFERTCRGLHGSSWLCGAKPANLIQHELGHMLDFAAHKNFMLSGALPKWQAWIAKQSSGAVALAKSRFRSWIGRYGLDFGASGHIDKAEFLAECYRAYRMGYLTSPKPSTLVPDFPDLQDIAAYFKKLGW